jgi:SET domain-containing protein
MVLEYIGQRIDKLESSRRCAADNRFIFHLDDEWDLDGDVAGNPARFLNHSCSPNCEAQEIAGQIWIVALRAIQAGEELTFNYGYDPEDYQTHPCFCGSPECVGYMVAEEFFDHVRSRSSLLVTKSA